MRRCVVRSFGCDSFGLKNATAHTSGHTEVQVCHLESRSHSLSLSLSLTYHLESSLDSELYVSSGP